KLHHRPNGLPLLLVQRGLTLAALTLVLQLEDVEARPRLRQVLVVPERRLRPLRAVDVTDEEILLDLKYGADDDLVGLDEHALGRVVPRPLPGRPPRLLRVEDVHSLLDPGLDDPGLDVGVGVRAEPLEALQVRLGDDSIDGLLDVVPGCIGRNTAKLDE